MSRQTGARAGEGLRERNDGRPRAGYSYARKFMACVTYGLIGAHAVKVLDRKRRKHHQRDWRLESVKAFIRLISVLLTELESNASKHDMSTCITSNDLSALAQFETELRIVAHRDWGSIQMQALLRQLG